MQELEKKKKVLITGASGFLGYHTVLEFINANFEVYAAVHSNVRKELVSLEKDHKIQVIKVNVIDFISLQNLFKKLPRLDVLVHCAARVSDIGWDNVFKEVNYNSTQHLTQLVKNFQVRHFCYISTTDVYGLKDFNGETEEETPLDIKCKNPYPKYKIKSEEWIRNSLPNGQYSIIRPATIWGEDDPTVTKRIKDFLESSPVIIHFGKWKGHNRVPLVHVKNVALAIFLASTEGRFNGHAINVLDSQKVTMDQFYQYIIRKYFPNTTKKTITIPMWIATIFAFFISVISNFLNLKHPITDPSLYALNMISANLDFSNKKFVDICSGRIRAKDLKL